MILRPFLALLCLCLLLPAAPALAANGDDDLDELRTPLGNEWRLTRHDQRRNIKTWSRLEDGKRYRSFKVEAELEGTEYLLPCRINFRRCRSCRHQTVCRQCTRCPGSSLQIHILGNRTSCSPCLTSLIPFTR